MGYILKRMEAKSEQVCKGSPQAPVNSLCGSRDGFQEMSPNTFFFLFLPRFRCSTQPRVAPEREALVKLTGRPRKGSLHGSGLLARASVDTEECAYAKTGARPWERTRISDMTRLLLPGACLELWKFPLGENVIQANQAKFHGFSEPKKVFSGLLGGLWFL